MEKRGTIAVQGNPEKDAHAETDENGTNRSHHFIFPFLLWKKLLLVAIFAPERGQKCISKAAIPNLPARIANPHPFANVLAGFRPRKIFRASVQHGRGNRALEIGNETEAGLLPILEKKGV